MEASVEYAAGLAVAASVNRVMLKSAKISFIMTD